MEWLAPLIVPYVIGVFWSFTDSTSPNDVEAMADAVFWPIRFARELVKAFLREIT